MGKEFRKNHSDSLAKTIEKRLWDLPTLLGIGSGAISVILGIISLFVSLSFASATEDGTVKALSDVLVLWCVMFMFVGGLGAVGCYRLFRAKIDARESAAMHERNMKSMRKMYRDLDRAFSKTNDESYLLFAGLAKAEERLVSAFELWANESAERLVRKEDMIAHSYSCDEADNWLSVRQEIADKAFEKKIVDEYSRYLCNVMNRVKEIVESYLEGKGFDLSVSTSFKLLTNPAGLSAVASSSAKKNVFTAYRDTKTYESRERNEGRDRLFCINRNSDFSYCISGHSFYIFNNVTSDHDMAYQNESDKHPFFYNAGVTVLVKSEIEDKAADQVVYGFLCCDVLNKEYPDKEIIDKNVAFFLMNAAAMVGHYCSQLEYTWNIANMDYLHGSIWKYLACRQGCPAQEA